MVGFIAPPFELHYLSTTVKKQFQSSDTFANLNIYIYYSNSESNNEYAHDCFEPFRTYYFLAGSTGYLTGTRIVIEGQDSLFCEYRPPLGQADLAGLKQVAHTHLRLSHLLGLNTALNIFFTPSKIQIWFHHMEEVNCGFLLIQASNLPLPRPLTVAEDSYRFAKVTVKCATRGELRFHTSFSI